MSVEWQSRDFLTDWTGLFNRRQSIDVPPSYARTARNVDFFGSAIGKRQGTKIVNGWATTVTGTWGLFGGTASGPVGDPSGFRVGDTLSFITPGSGTIGSGTITTIAGTTVSLSPFSGTLPTANVSLALVRRDLGARTDGLYHAVFRDGTEVLLASAGGVLWNVWGTPINAGVSYQPTALTTQFPTTTISANWTAYGSGPVTTVNTLVAYNHSTAGQTNPNSVAFAPDIIQIVHAGTVIYEGLLVGFLAGPGIVLYGTCSQYPVAGDTVIFFPHRIAADTRFAMLNNHVYVASALAGNPPQSSNAAPPNGSGPGLQANQRQPPVVIEQPAAGGQPYVRRMGVRAPTFAPTIGATTPGPLAGYCTYRYTYVNTLTGQESEASPISVNTNFANANGQVTVNASPDPQVGGINVYRTITGQGLDPSLGGGGSWYLVNPTPLSNVAQTYTDSTIDPALGPLLKTFVNEPPPDTITMFAVWTQAGALIGVDNGTIAEGGENVAWSDAPDLVNGTYKCESWPINNTLFVNRDDGDTLRSLGPFYDSVVVWKGRSMHRIVGAPPDIILQPISFRDDQTGVGIWSAKGFIMDADVAIFASDDGFYQVSRYEGVQQGFTSSRISRAIDQEWIGRTGTGSSMTDTSHRKLHLIYHRLKHRLQAFACVDGFTDPMEMFLYQLEGTVEGSPHGWSEWSLPVDYRTAIGAQPPQANNFVSASCIVHYVTNQEAPYYGCGPLGLIVQADVGAGEWQSLPVMFEYETVWFSAAGAGTSTRGRACDYVVQATSGQPVLWLLVGQDFAQLDTYTLPALAVQSVPGNLNTLFLSLGQYHSLGTYEQSVTGLFLILDFTFWFQRLPVGVTSRIALATPSTGGPPS